MKLVQWFLRRRFLNVVNVFLLFHNYLPLENRRALHFDTFDSSSPKDELCQVWLKLAQWFWRRSRNRKSLQTDRQTNRQADRQTPDERRSEKLTSAFSSGELTITISVGWLNGVDLPLFEFFTHGDVTIAGEGLQLLTYACSKLVHSLCCFINTILRSSK